MDLKDFLTGKENKSTDLYWALVLEPGWVQAGIWKIEGGKAEVVSTSPVTPWEVESELIGASDTALSSAVQTLPEGLKEPSKTVFGVPPSWVDKGQIKEEHLFKIKNICSELSLDPTGFVVLSEAIAHLIKVEEGSPLNAAVIGSGKDYLELSVFKLGNLVGTTSVARSVSFFDDVIEGLSRFSLSDNIPSRIIVYDGKEGELEEAKEVLMGGDWEKVEKVKFLHTPKVETLNPEKKVIAVSLAGAAEIGGVTEIEEKEEVLPEEAVSKDHENVITPKELLSPQELGFVVGEDVAAKVPPQVERQPQVVPGQPMVAQKPVYKFHLLDSLKKKFNLIFSKLPKKSIIRSPKIGGKKNFTVIGSIVGSFISLLLLFWILYPKASVRVFVSPKRFEEKVDATILKGSGSSDISNKILAGQIAKAEVSGEKTKSTTGSKKIGDKARGSVNVQNGTGSILKLPGGTAITSANNLKFTLVNSASVSAALSPSTPGTQVVEVAAADIGAEYNLAKGEVFSVGTFAKSEVDAVSTADFTGGSSRDISAVSASDAESLLENLTTELLGDAKRNLLGSVPSNYYLIEDSLVATPSSKVYSSKVGDEASNVKLSLSLKTSALYVSKEELIRFSQEVLGNSVPSGFYLDPSNLSFNFSLAKDTSSASQFNLTVIADFLPKEDLLSVSKTIAGKSPALVERILSKTPGFLRAEINIKPRLPGFFGSLPRLSKNISVELLNER